jgi:hypothetical protein
VSYLAPLASFLAASLGTHLADKTSASLAGEAALFYDLTRDSIANNFVITIYSRCLCPTGYLPNSIRSKVISYATKCKMA